LGGIGLLKNIKRELRPVGDRSVELGLGFCFQQSVYPRVGYVAGNAGRGLQKSPTSRLIAVIGKSKHHCSFTQITPIGNWEMTTSFWVGY
jgi:hypothetical protein